MKKGFTLIELLGVIVIMALIALIATPIVNNILEEAEIKSAILSAESYKDAIYNAYTRSTLKETEASLNGRYDVDGNSLIGLNTITVEMGGTMPSAGYVVYNDTVLTNACLVIKGYQIKYENNEFHNIGKGNCSNSSYALYYTIGTNGVRSEFVYDEKDIPSEWDTYYKVTLGSRKDLYAPAVYLNQEGNTEYSSFEECELDGNICYTKYTYDGPYYLFLKTRRYSLKDDNEENALNCNYANEYNNSNYSCVKKTNVYKLYERLMSNGQPVAGHEPELKKYFTTQSECETNITSDEYYCEVGNVYDIYSTSIEIYPLENNMGITSCSEVNQLTSKNMEVLSCNLVTALDLDVSSYTGDFASSSECEQAKPILTDTNSLATNSSEQGNTLNFTSTCRSFNGYYFNDTSNPVKLANNTTVSGDDAKYYHPAFETQQGCQLVNNHTCTLSRGYTVETRTVGRFESFNSYAPIACENLEISSVYHVNSCNYTYLTSEPITTKYFGFGGMAASQYKFNTMSECLNYNVNGICFKTHTYIDEKIPYINIAGLNKKIQFTTNYDSDKALLDEMFGESINVSHNEGSVRLSGKLYPLDLESKNMINSIISAGEDVFNTILDSILSSDIHAVGRIIQIFDDEQSHIMIANNSLYASADGVVTKIDAGD